MVCPVCREAISQDMKFCGRCGVKIPRCPVCGKVIEKRMRFCLNDGTPLPEEILSVFPPKEVNPHSVQDAPETATPQKTTALLKSDSSTQNGVEFDINRGMVVTTAEKVTGEMTPQRFCLICGRPCQPGMELCTDCQDKIIEREAAVSRDSPKNVRRHRRFRALPIVIVLLLIVALAGSVAGYIAFSGGLKARNGGGEEKENVAPDTEALTIQEEQTQQRSDTPTIEDTPVTEDSPTTDHKPTTDSSASRSVLEENIRQIQSWYSNPGETNRKIIVPAGTDDWADTREYFFHDGKLYFAFFYQGADTERRLYFKNDTLIRYIDESHIVYDDNLAQFRYWEIQALMEATRLISESPVERETVEPSEFILEESDSRYIAREELLGFSAAQCRLARNELYARHGRIFASEDLRAYFSAKSWYHPSIEPDDFKEEMLNSYEAVNRDLILAYEQEMGYR